jgi:hypothetical protein
MNVRGQNRQSGQRKGSVDGSPSVYLLGFTLLYGWIDGTAGRAFGTNERNGRIPTYLPITVVQVRNKKKGRNATDGTLIQYDSHPAWSFFQSCRDLLSTCSTALLS